MSDANPRKRGQGRGKRRTDAGPRTGPSSRGRRSRPPRRDSARPAESAAAHEAPSPEAPAPEPGPTLPGDRGVPEGHIESDGTGFIGDAPLPDRRGTEPGDPVAGSPADAAGAAEPRATEDAARATRATGETARATRAGGAASRTTGTVTATAQRTAQSAPPRGTPRPRLSQSAVQRLRKALLAVATVDGVALALIIGVAIIGVTVTGAGFTPLPATIASMWMLLNMAPFGYGGTDLSLVPAVPAMLLFAAVAWRVRRVVADRIGIQEVRTLAAVFVAVPVALTVTAWLMLWDASGVLRVDAPSFLQSVASTVVLHGAALLTGFGPRLLRALLRRRKLPEWPLGSLRLAVEYVGGLWVAGVAVTLASLVWHHDAVRETLAIADSPGAAAALVLLSLAYLPNVAFGAAGILAGAPANVGVAEAGLFAVTPGTLPPLPTLAAMPQSHVSPFFGVLLIVPVAIALWRVTVYVRNRAMSRPYVEVVVAALFAAVLVAVLALLLGGEAGQYGWSGVSWWFAAVMASVWFVVPGAVAVVALTGVPSRSLADEASPASAAEADDAGGAEEPAEPEDAGETEGTEDTEESGEAEGTEASEETGDAEEAEGVEESAEAEGSEGAAEAPKAAEVDAESGAGEYAGDDEAPAVDVDADAEAEAEAESEVDAEPLPEPSDAPGPADAAEDGDSEADVGKQRG